MSIPARALTLLATCLLASAALGSDGVEVLLQQLDESSHTSQLSTAEVDVVDHEIGLGALRKVGGTWRFKDSERLTGRLQSYTWQILDGFTAEEVMDELLAGVEAQEGARSLFSCDGRACGHGAQWANRVFRERLLYGRQDMQRYRVYAIEGASAQRLLVYAAMRSADRHYLRVDLLRIAP